MAVDFPQKKKKKKMKDVYERAKASLEKHPNVLVFTGAGASADSGIPTFRGDAFSWWEGILGVPALFLVGTGTGWYYLPWLCWLLYDFFMRRKVLAADPNAFHYLLSDLHKKGKNVFVITQNVDGLHQKSGLPQDKVYDAHGTLWISVCSKKGCNTIIEELEPTFFTSRFKVKGVPNCPTCGAGPRPGAVLFNDYMYPALHSHEKLDVMAILDSMPPKETTTLVVGLSGQVATAEAMISSMGRENPEDAYVIDPRPSKYTQGFGLQWIQGRAAEFAEHMKS